MTFIRTLILPIPTFAPTETNLKLTIMGRGDKKTKRGKIAIGTFGKVRPHKQITQSVNKQEPEEQNAKRTRNKKDESSK